MTYKLPINVDDVLKKTYEEIASKFPQNFSDIPSIRIIESTGWKLTQVDGLFDNSPYMSSQLQDFIREFFLPEGFDAGCEGIRVLEDVNFHFSSNDSYCSEQILEGKVAIKGNKFEVKFKYNQTSSMQILKPV